MSVRKLILFGALVVLGWTAAAASPSGLKGVQWTLTHVNGREVEDSRAFIEIAQNGGRFSGNAGCNRMFGMVSITGKRIQFSNIGTTKMACRSDRMIPSEEAMINALRSAAKFSLKSNSLVIKDRSGRNSLRFRRLVKLPPVVEPTDDPGLGDRKWTLETVTDGGTVVPKGRIFVNFDPAKKGVGGNSGCNVFGGEYSTDGNSIAIKDMISTMRACIEDDRMSIERKLYDGLRSANRFEITGERLKLFRGDELLLTFRGEKK
ncbi:MAG: META domain-containing protein [Chloracidobacterium sp.]|nr:META domain-containing protein [Chloracidobacterium sp.]